MDKHIFSNENINAGRQRELDWARGLAVVFMVLVHVKEELPGFPLSDTYSMVIEFLGSPLAAPVFMTLLGVGIVYSKSFSPKRLAMQGIRLIILHYALNLTAFGLPQLIMFVKTGGIEFLEGGINDTLGVDILAFAGLTFLFFALMAKLRLKSVHITLILLLLSCANLVLTRPVEGIAAGAVLGLFIRANEFSYFPFLSWIGYPVMGYVFARALIRCSDKKLFYIYLFCFSSLTILAVSLVAYKYNFDIWSMHFGPEYYYYQDYMQYLLVGGIVFSWISVLYAVSGMKAARIIASKTVYRWSKNTTIIYFTQWLIIGWLSRMELIDVPAVPFVNLTLGIVIFILSDVAAYLFLILNNKTLATKKAV